MYTENAARDVLLFAKAFLSNQLARFSPGLYVRLTHQTGRGEGADNAAATAEYFVRCFHDYREQFGLDEPGFAEFLRGRKLLEYGPGDVLGVALLMYAHGAEHVTCVDQFALSSLSDTNLRIYRHLLQSLSGAPRQRADSAFREAGDPASGFRPEAIVYKVTGSGLSGAQAQYDLVISRAVLEHVNDLDATMRDIRRSLVPGGVSLHQVDLKSHGLDRYVPLDFLTWPSPVYRLMYGHKGFPNRWRVDRYRQLAEGAGLRMKHLSPTTLLEPEKVAAIHPQLAKEFAGISHQDLSWLGFWMLLEHA